MQASVVLQVQLPFLFPLPSYITVYVVVQGSESWWLSGLTAPSWTSSNYIPPRPLFNMTQYSLLVALEISDPVGSSTKTNPFRDRYRSATGQSVGSNRTFYARLHEAFLISSHPQRKRLTAHHGNFAIIALISVEILVSKLEFGSVIGYDNRLAL